jgi:glucosylceramidase
MNPGEIEVIRTAEKTGARMVRGQSLRFERSTEDGQASIMVDASTRYQVIEGFGGAFTEAAAFTFSRMDSAAQSAILKAYFDPVDGLGYSLCRTHINSCDFSLGNYAYDETPGDVELKHFSVQHDRRMLIPLIRAAAQVAGGALKLLATPWSPPAWMKTNGQMNHGGKLKSEYRDAWARYYVRYVRAYAEEGIQIWGCERAERARSHPNLGFVSLQRRGRARLRARPLGAGAACQRPGPPEAGYLGSQPRPHVRAGQNRTG